MIGEHLKLEIACYDIPNQRRIQDFPREATTPRGAHQHTILPNFPEKCTKLKEFGCPGGAHTPCPPKSATANE